MKKRIKLFVAFVALATMSCRKTYTCECRIFENSQLVSKSSPSVYTNSQFKARKQCQNLSYDNGTQKQSCDLK